VTLRAVDLDAIAAAEGTVTDELVHDLRERDLVWHAGG
jgi:hypothetical protein